MVAAAALIVISVFAGFVLADDAIVKSLGFALAFGVAVDEFVVRMTIVPAVLSLLGRSARLAKARLRRSAAAPAPACTGSAPRTARSSRAVRR